jgi:hypothetical protein
MNVRNRLNRLARDRRLSLGHGTGANANLQTIHLKTIADLLPLLEEQVDAVRRDDESSALEKARSIGYLLGVALRAIEVGDLAARFEALETVLKLRNGDRGR